MPYDPKQQEAKRRQDEARQLLAQQATKLSSHDSLAVNPFVFFGSKLLTNPTQLPVITAPKKEAAVFVQAAKMAATAQLMPIPTVLPHSEKTVEQDEYELFYSRFNSGRQHFSTSITDKVTSSNSATFPKSEFEPAPNFGRS